MLLSFLLEVLRLEHTIPRMLLAALSSVASYKDALQILVSALVRACLILCTAIASIMCWGPHCTAGPPMEKVLRPSFRGRLGPGMWPLADPNPNPDPSSRIGPNPNPNPDPKPNPDTNPT